MVAQLTVVEDRPTRDIYAYWAPEEGLWIRSSSSWKGLLAAEERSAWHRSTGRGLELESEPVFAVWARCGRTLRIDLRRDDRYAPRRSIVYSLARPTGQICKTCEG
jgi:hypothetical protein